MREVTRELVGQAAAMFAGIAVAVASQLWTDDIMLTIYKTFDILAPAVPADIQLYIGFALIVVLAFAAWVCMIAAIQVLAKKFGLGWRF